MARSPPSACIIFSLLPLMFKRYSSSKIMAPRTVPLTLQSPLFPATISERVYEAVLYPGSLTLMVLPLIEVARTQCPPLCTFRMTISPALREEWMLPLATFPTQERPRGLTDPQTKRSPLTQPPCPLSQVFKDPGLQFFPIPERAMETELIKHPALQMVLDEVPSCSLPHRESHCLYIGQLLHAERTRIAARRRILAVIVLNNRLFITWGQIRLMVTNHPFYGLAENGAIQVIE